MKVCILYYQCVYNIHIYLFQYLGINQKFIQTKHLAQPQIKMPKILSVPGHNDSSFQSPNAFNNKFARIDNNSHLRNSQYYTPVVPIHEVSYNPQFSKSPLASVQMTRKHPVKYIEPLPTQIRNIDTDYHVQRGQTQQKIDWKKILFWVLAALALIALAVGIYFLVDALLSKNTKKSTEYVQPQTYNIQKNPNPTGVNPIYVNPIPFSNMQGASVSNWYPSTTVSDPNMYVTSPISTTSYNSVTYPTTSPTISMTNPAPKLSDTRTATEPRVQWNANPSDNSISPLDVYATYRS